MRFQISLKRLLIVMAFFAVYFYYFRYFLDLEIKRNNEGRRMILEGRKASLEQELVRLNNPTQQNEVPKPRRITKWPPSKLNRIQTTSNIWRQRQQWTLDTWKKQARQELEEVEGELDKLLGVDPLEEAIKRLKKENEIGQGDAGSD